MRLVVEDAPASTDRATWWHKPDAWLCGALLLVFSFRYDLVQGLNIGVAAALLVAPLWWRRAVGFRWFRALVAAGIAGLAVGFWLSWAHVSWLGFSSTLARIVGGMVVELVIGVALVLWARTVMPAPIAAIVFSVGLMLSSHTNARFSENIWRFGVGPGITIAVLAFAWIVNRTWFSIVATLMVTLAWVVAGGRSAAAVTAIVLAACIGQAMLHTRGRRLSRPTVIAGGIAVGLLVFTVGQAAVLQGYLGDDAQQRSETQVQESGSLIAGGRPELGASLELFAYRPSGFGIGTVANGHLVMVAKQGMARLNYDANNGYVETYMFGSGMELHSTLADLWAHFGFGGVLIAVVLALGVFLGLVDRIGAMRAPPLLIFLAVTLAWDLAFTPLWSAVMNTVLAFGLVTLPRPVVRAVDDQPAVQVVATLDRGALSGRKPCREAT